MLAKDAKRCNGVLPSVLPLGELSPQVTERVLLAFSNDTIPCFFVNSLQGFLRILQNFAEIACKKSRSS